MHFHEGYLRRIFKEAYGKAPNAALRDIRMSEAKKLIDAGELQIQQIARRVGFEDAPTSASATRATLVIRPPTGWDSDTLRDKNRRGGCQWTSTGFQNLPLWRGAEILRR